MKACILVGVQPESEATVLEALTALHGVVDGFEVLGRSEVVLRADLPGMDDLAGLLKEVTETEGVVVSETLLEIPEEAIH